MTTLREAAQQALEAMLNFPDDISDEMFESITALKAALAKPACCCGEPSAPGIVHRTDGPCYMAEPVQEPVACHVFNVTVTGSLHEWEPTTFAFALRDGKHALYTSPPQRKPLTEEEIKQIVREATAGSAIRRDGSTSHRIARAIERAHGIGEQP